MFRASQLFLHKRAAAFALLGFFACTPQSARPPAQGGDPNRVIGQYIAILKPGTKPDLVLTVFAEYGAHSISTIDKDTYLFFVRTDPGPEAMTLRAAQTPQIVRVQPNFVYRQIQGGRVQ